MKRLTESDPVVDFIVEDHLGNTVRLTENKSDKILLSFFRGASCPFCNLRVNQLIGRYSEFEKKGIGIITVFAASKDEISAYAGKQNAPFPIIADPSLTLYKKYGVEESPLGMFKTMMDPPKMMRVLFSGFFNLKSITDRPIVPADFLIDAEYQFHRIHYGKDFGDHIPIEEILNWEK